MNDSINDMPWVDRHLCPVCDNSVFDTEVTTLDSDTEGQSLSAYSISCSRCGQFILDDRLANSRPWLATDYPHTATVLCHAIQRMQPPPDSFSQAETVPPRITPELIERVLDQHLPAPSEQADRLLLWIGDHTHAPGDYVHINERELEAIVGTATNTNFVFVINSLINAKIAQEQHQGAWAELALTFSGWDRYDELKRGVSDSRSAFMAIPFGHQDLNHVYRECFKPAIAKAGFELRRMDEDPVAGSIHDQMRVEILRARFLIADLTYGNQGAYWEAGYAEGLKKPVIYTCEKGFFEEQGTHFDTNNLHTVIWDADNLAAAAAALTATVRATFPDEAILGE